MDNQLRVSVLVTVYDRDTGETRAELDWSGTPAEMYKAVTRAARAAGSIPGLVSLRPFVAADAEAV